MRPLLFLDVDGVLNAFRPRSGDWGDWKHCKASDDIGTYRVRYSPSMLKRLQALDADIVWCTTWGHYANISLCPLFDWEPLPVIEIDRNATDPVRWKQEGVQDYLLDHARRPFIWIDDDVCRQAWVRSWANNIGWLNRLIHPSSSRGLTEEEVVRIEQFVNDCQRQSRTYF